jgi:succinyl-CoA synthetase beta subunit
VARLLEHHGKRLLAEAGIPVPRGALARSVEEAVAAKIGFPVAVKAQIAAGKRGLAGGVRFAANEAELRATVGALVGSTLHNQRVETVLVEQKIEIEREIYLAIVSDPSHRGPAAIFSANGGMDIEESADAAVVSAIDIRRGAPFYWALDFVRERGFDGRTAVALARVLNQLYAVYRRYECTLAEINPLAVTKQGLVALDARINLDDDALFRHEDIGIERTEEVGGRPPSPFEQIAAKIDEHDYRGSAHFVQIDPDGAIAKEEGKIPIGFDGVGTGVSLTVMDELVPLGFLPMNFCDTSGNPSGAKLYRVTKVILSQPGIEGYVFACCLSSQQLDVTASGLVKAFKEIYGKSGRIEPNIPCVFAFRGAWDETALALFERHGLTASPWIRVLGRDSTERTLAQTFANLHREWRAQRGGR